MEITEEVEVSVIENSGNGGDLMSPTVSAIISVQNGAGSVSAFFDGLKASLGEISADFEVIFVDDGSTDETPDLLRSLAEEHEQVQVIRMRATFGDASALDAGLKLARGDLVLFNVLKVNVNPDQIGALFEELQERNDMVVGWRQPRRDSRLNQFISQHFNRLASRISGLDLHDINSGIFLARRDVFENISSYGNMNHFIPMLAARQGFRVAEARIEQLSGTFRESRNPNEYIQRVLDIITVFFLSNYSKRPLHFLGFFGATFMLAGGGISVYLFFYRILGFGGIAGRPMLLLGVLLLVIGLQMISIGLLGEMIIFTHASEIKEYNIEETVRHPRGRGNSLESLES